MRWGLLRDLRWKLLALAFASVLWVIVNREAEITTSVEVPIEYRNLPEGLEIASNAPQQVMVQVRGPSARLTRDVLRELAVVLDCAAVQRSGPRTFNIGRRELRRPFGIALDSAVPSQVTLNFERSYSRDVPVEPSYSAPPPPGYAIASYRIEPPTVRIEGPESRVRAIGSAETDPIDLSGVYGRTEVHVPAHLPDPRVRLDASTPLLTYEVVLQKTPVTKETHH